LDSDCADLIGRPYSLQGADSTLNCIQLVYEVRGRQGFTFPSFNPEWMKASTRAVLRELLAWGERTDGPTYDGMVALLPQDSWAFAVVWSGGLLYINQALKQVAWMPLSVVGSCHFFRARNGERSPCFPSSGS
jgi:hypothetical protein